MKWLAFLFPLLAKQLGPAVQAFNQASLQVREDLSFKARKIAILFLVGITTAVLCSGGILMVILEVAQQLERAEAIHFNSIVITGTSLALFSLLTLLFAFSFWPGVQARKRRLKIERYQMRAQQQKLGQAVSLDQALAMLILDFVKEREQKRQPDASLTPTET